MPVQVYKEFSTNLALNQKVIKLAVHFSNISLQNFHCQITFARQFVRKWFEPDCCRWAAVKIFIFFITERGIFRGMPRKLLSWSQTDDSKKASASMSYSLYGSALKGLFHEMDLAFDEIYG